MEKDRTAICNIISEMLDNPDECGIYGTTKAYDRLERYVEQQRVQAIGWCVADACVQLDEGQDYRKVEVLKILERALKDLA